jgi:hypothetical protein
MSLGICDWVLACELTRGLIGCGILRTEGQDGPAELAAFLRNLSKVAPDEAACGWAFNVLSRRDDPNLDALLRPRLAGTKNPGRSPEQTSWAHKNRELQARLVAELLIERRHLEAEHVAGALIVAMPGLDVNASEVGSFWSAVDRATDEGCGSFPARRRHAAFG